MTILDTDTLSILERQTFEAGILANNLKRFEVEISTTIITFEEQMRGWLAFSARTRTIEQEINAYRKLNGFLDDYRKMPVVAFDAQAARIFQQLKSSKIRVGTMDLKIASIALANDALLLSRNLKDFEQIPNLKVEDWTIEQAGLN